MTENSEDDTLSRRVSFLVISLIVGVAALAGTLLCEKQNEKDSTQQTLGWTDEQILTLPYFEIVAAAGENHNLPYDVKSYSIGDGIIHLVLPDAVPDKGVVVYVRDAEGQNLARHVYDFSEKVMIGPWEIVLDHHNLPTLYFESDDPAVYETMITAETKGIICDGRFRVCVSGDSFPAARESEIRASLRGRGHSSWKNVGVKKSFSLSLEEPRNLLGLGKNRNWNLIGNGFDHSLIKNPTFNEFSKKLGIEYQPRMQNVNLYVDGVYRGVYTLTTKITVNKDRIALKPDDFLYRLDPNSPEAPIRYTSTAWVDDHEPHYPVADLVYPEVADADVEKAAYILQRFINARDNPSDPTLGDICDIRSLATYYWIQEISMNFDANSASVYFFYRASDGKIHFGPVWDMDLTLGVIDYKEDVLFNEPTGWKVRQLGVYRILFERPEFVNAVNDLYYNGGIRDAMLSAPKEFEAQKAAVGEDGRLNFLLYGHVTQSHLDYPYGDTYDEYTDNMIAFYNARASWIDEQMSR